MNELAIILIIVVSFAAGCIVASILSRVNDLQADAVEPEPLGDMVDVRAIVKRYSE